MKRHTILLTLGLLFAACAKEEATPPAMPVAVPDCERNATGSLMLTNLTTNPYLVHLKRLDGDHDEQPYGMVESSLTLTVAAYAYRVRCVEVLSTPGTPAQVVVYKTVPQCGTGYVAIE